MSLRARLLVGMVLVAAVLGIAAVVITRTTRAHLVDQVDAQLERAGGPAVGLSRLPGKVGGGLPDHGEGDTNATQQTGSRRLSPIYVADVHADGTVESRVVPDIGGQSPPLPRIDGAKALAMARSHQPYTVGGSDGGPRYRVVARLAPSGGDAVVVAQSLADVDDAVEQLVVVEVLATAAVLAVLGLVTWWVVRLGVRPIKAMTSTATAIAAGELSHRVPAVAPGTEAGELGTALNQMLARIEEAFAERTRSQARLRDFVADASHELRTPVATIRGYAELYRSGALDDAHELSEAMRRTEDEAIRMGSLVDDLLHLARLDQGRLLGREPVDLTALAADAVRDASAVAPTRPITAELAEPVKVVGDEARLRQVIGNLVGNALVHTPPGTPIAVHVRRSGERAVLEVVDRGPGMGTEAAARAFERFYRADPARSRHRGGAGLGLAIVEATARAHGGDVSLTSTPGEGTTVRVELPLTAPS